MNIIDVKIEKLAHCFAIPSYQTKGAAGSDLYAAHQEDIILAPMARTLVPTGIKIMLPENTEAQIRPRSGLALKNGIILPNSPGTIDSDYRGEIKVIMMNLSQEDFIIERGMRIAQMVIAPVPKVTFTIVAQLDDHTQRGENGFGSTGILTQQMV